MSSRGPQVSTSQYWDYKPVPPYLAFVCEFWGSCSDPHACEVNTLSREPFPQPHYSHFLFFVRGNKIWPFLITRMSICSPFYTAWLVIVFNSLPTAFKMLSVYWYSLPWTWSCASLVPILAANTCPSWRPPFCLVAYKADLCAFSLYIAFATEATREIIYPSYDCMWI